MREPKRRHLRWLMTKSRSLLTLAWLLSAIGCSRRADDCNYNLTCGNFASDASGQDAAASVCGAPCSNGTHCDNTLKKCVECGDAGNCTASKPFCNSSNHCVECLGDNDCTDPSKSVCSGGTCTSCSSSTECQHLSTTPICKTSQTSDAGLCVQCTEDSVCKGKSCNPATNQCTMTTVGTVKTCEPCVTDSECDSANGTSRCIAMNFKGTPLGGFCLALATAAGCPQPYSVAITAVSLSGAPSTNYCGIDETLTATSCKALLDLTLETGPKNCTNDTECGLGQGDGLCRTVGTLVNRCTIPCGSGSNCLNSAPGNSCVTATPKYCQ